MPPVPGESQPAMALGNTASPLEQASVGPSYPVQPIFVPSEGKLAFVTMCIGQEMGASGQADCKSSVCSLSAVIGPNATIVVLVNRLFASTVKALMADMKVFIVEVPSVNWDETNHRYPPPKRLYTFMKFHVWRLVQFDCIVWFDIDIFFRRDPSALIARHRSTPQRLVAYAYTKGSYFDDKSIPYINTGFMILQPSLGIFGRLAEMWRSGNYSRMAQTVKWEPTEQDLLCNAVRSVFGGFVTFDPCVNFRGFSGRAEQRHCDQNDLILNHSPDGVGICEIHAGRPTLAYVAVPLTLGKGEKPMKGLMPPSYLPSLTHLRAGSVQGRKG